MPGFTPIAHHDVLMWLVQLTLLLASARLLGEVALRMGQSSVIGEILAGILLGPSVLSTLVPAFGDWFLPHHPGQGHLLEVISLLGAMLLLLITGLEMDLPLIRHHARTALSASFVGILFTSISGFLLGLWLPDFLLTDPAQRTVFALFIAVSLVISSIPVIAKVLMDLNLMRRDISQTILAAGMSDDTIGWILLSVVAGIATAGAVTVGGVAQALGSVALFIAISFTVGRWAVKRALDWVQDEVGSPYRLLTLVMVLTFGWSAVAQGLGLEAVLGAFVIGILLAQLPRLPSEIPHRLEALTMGIFAPIFFAVAGLKVNLLTLFSNPQLLGLALLFLLVASVSKIAGTYLGARFLAQREHWTALGFGAGLNARGAMGIIVASLGLDLGILTPEMFAIILLMAIGTSLVAPFALRAVLGRVPPSPTEQARLRREALAHGSLLARTRRVLLPVRGAQNVPEAAHLIEQIATAQPLSLTLLHVTDEEGRAAGTALLDELAPLFNSVEVVKKVVTQSDASRAILEEARKDYDLLLLGASEPSDGSTALFTPTVDYLVRAAPCATLVVKGALAEGHWPPRRILVPTNGSSAARHAAEVAFALAPTDIEHEVTILNVVRENQALTDEVNDSQRTRRLGMAHEAVEQLRALGETQGIRTDGDVRVGPEVVPVVLEVAQREQMDLIILGTDLRVGSETLYLGPRVEAILAGAPCPVVVVNA